MTDYERGKWETPNACMITRICVICRESTGIDYRIDQSCICARCAEKLRKLLYESETAEGKDDG